MGFRDVRTAGCYPKTKNIATGISGALQHMAGCSGSKWMVAINKDPEAHIFKEADFGVIGDYRNVLKQLIDECRASGK